jgi:hypothetical protein
MERSEDPKVRAFFHRNPALLHTAAEAAGP